MKLIITTEVSGEELNHWLGNSQVLTVDQQIELTEKGKVVLQRTPGSKTTYKLTNLPKKAY